MDIAVEKESAIAEYGSFWDFKGKTEYADKWPLMGSPYIVLAIVITYLFFVLKCGKLFMANREPYKMRKVLIVYNAFQVALSAYLMIYGLRIIAQTGFVEKGCKMEEPAFKYEVVAGHYIYFVAKLSELLDTIFFVLRKKWNQVSFLHVYHHSMMVLVSWVAVKYDPSSCMVFVGSINSFVHVIMYSYYALAAFPGLQKYLWWKKYITKLQLVQFMMMLVQATWYFNTTSCPPSYFLLTICWSQTILFLYLFTDFYLRSYTKPKQTKAKLEDKISHNVAGNRRSTSIGQ